jgi:LysR family transcriptional regulator, glycine cleavage system transcriptional activator
MSLPSLESLRCFIEAARFLNFRSAAHAVALTPAALGQRIRQLEEEVGTPLFQRTTRRVWLTEAGLGLLPHATRVLAGAQDCLRAARGEIGPAPIDLVLGTRHELGMSWVVPMLPALRREFPHVTFHLYFGSSADLLMRVRNLEVDCAIGSMRAVDPKVDSVRVHGEEYAFVAQPRLLKRLPFNRPEHAHRHTLIDTTAELSLFRYFRDAPGAGDRLDFSKILRMGTIAALAELVLRGDGVAVIPAYLIARELKSRRLVRLFPHVKLLSDHFRLIFRTDDTRRTIYEKLAAFMAAQPLK